MAKSANVAAKGCCGPIQDRIALIKKVSSGLRDGHMGLAQLYSSIATDIEEAKERKQFEDMAATHRKMADDSLKVLVPDGEEGEG